MKKIFLFLIISVCSINITLAQDYSCISSLEQKTYFTNSNGYLRGMRIDSIQRDGQFKMYFPFKTPRANINQNPSIADTNGGSWLGGIIIEDTINGITKIPTMHGDTVRINNNANYQDHWLFYQDTAARYYTATIIAVDTTSIAGILDSIKIIQIHAMEDTTIINSDTLNNLELILSKNHGLLQTFGLYLFPYKNIDQAPDYYQMLSFGDVYNQAVLTFKRVPFRYPVIKNVFDFDTGDVFVSQQSNSGTSNYNATYTKRILSKITTDSSYTYDMAMVKNWQDGSALGSDTSSPTVMMHFGNLIDTLKMPEEWLNPVILNYWSDDTSFCINSPLYHRDNSLISENGYYEDFEQAIELHDYKNGLGEINSYAQPPSTGGGFPTISIQLISARKNGHACDQQNRTLGIAPYHENAISELKIYPNPAKQHIIVQLLPNKYPNQPIKLTITDLLGRALLSQHAKSQSKIILPTQFLPNGLYLLKVTGKHFMLTKKIAVMH